MRGDEAAIPVLFADSDIVSAVAWTDSWRQRLETEGRSLVEVADEMDRANPIYIPRNHLVEEVLASATAGDMEPFEELLDVVTDGYARDLETDDPDEVRERVKTQNLSVARISANVLEATLRECIVKDAAGARPTSC